ncbi:MAG TPA: acetyl-CoA carboxylase biotin carboxylase subunit [Candidatus Kapabacteria bacterium]|nr:acetyl-CoA carboxylase biotin carboxylase subunit [Candidatus Kapabacteria bacterium]
MSKQTRQTKHIKKILIANRGEIALRVIRACKELGIRSVAVYSDADANAAHVQMADDAYNIGEPPPLKSYLNQDKIIAAAKKSHADAIHPGYGFLSENPVFAKRVRDESMIFIGPSAEAIRMLGDKTAARALAHKIGVPTAAGTINALESTKEAITVAKKVGFPIVIKAAAGGGGKGMRVVESEKDMESAVQAAQREALGAFGDSRVFVEKYIHHPKHIEFQILADEHGNVIHLGERECSIQRRHQKVVEESPSLALTPELRNQMGETACKLIKEAGYTNAGTVEFLLDNEKNFYFLEVNTRLQVEHPVTEMVTGIDLVQEQIAIAEGKPLRFTQGDVIQRGWAIECRIIAEDPMNNFLPSTGTIAIGELPEGIGVRNDTAIRAGMEVLPFYDSMLGKLIVHAETREKAVGRTIRALNEFFIAGVSTSIPFCKFVAEHESFKSGQYNTGFVEKYITDDSLKNSDDVLAAAAAAALFARPSNQNGVKKHTESNWKKARFFET